MANFVTRETIVANAYRKAEAMYRRGCNACEIARALDLSKTEALDIVQKIFAMDMRRNSIEGLR